MNTSHGIIWGIIFFFYEQVMRLFLKCILCQISPLSRGYNKKESLIAGTSWSPLKNYPMTPLSGFPALLSQGSKTCLSKAQVGVSHSVWKDVPLGLRWGQRIRFRQVLCVFPEFSQKLGSDKGQQIKNKKNPTSFMRNLLNFREREREAPKESPRRALEKQESDEKPGEWKFVSLCSGIVWVWKRHEAREEVSAWISFSFSSWRKWPHFWKN